MKSSAPKKYKVVGSQPILDHKPGETFEQNISADLEAYLVGIGGLAVITDIKVTPKRAYRD